jgi:hypothetical protein
MGVMGSLGWCSQWSLSTFGDARQGLSNAISVCRASSSLVASWQIEWTAFEHSPERIAAAGL